MPLTLHFIVRSNRYYAGEELYKTVLYKVLQIVASNVLRWRVAEIEVRARFAFFVHTSPPSLERLRCEGVPIHYTPCLDMETINTELRNSFDGIVHPKVGQSHTTVTQNLWPYEETYSFPPFTQRKYITIPALVDLTIGLKILPKIREHFDSITLPALRRLEILGSADIDVVGMLRISSLIRRSSASLVELCFCDACIPTFEMADILLQSPELEVLIYRQTKIGYRYARALMERLTRGSTMCPSLRKATIVVDDVANVKKRNFIGFDDFPLAFGQEPECKSEGRSNMRTRGPTRSCGG